MKEVGTWSKDRNREDLEPLFQKLAAKPEQVWQLTRGEDYNGADTSVMALAYQYAKLWHMKAHTSRVRPGVIEVQFVKADQR